MWPLGQLAAKLFNQPGFADARLTDNQDELSGASKSAFRAASQDCEVLFATDERGEKPGASSAPSAAYPQDAKEIHWRKSALELMGPLVLNDEQPSNLSQERRSDQHCPRLGRCLHARSDIRCIAKDFAGRLHDDRAGLDPDACLEFRRAPGRVPGVEVCKRPLDRERRPNSAFGIIFQRARIAE